MEGSVEPEHSRDRVPAEPAFLVRRLLPLAISEADLRGRVGAKISTVQRRNVDPPKPNHSVFTSRDHATESRSRYRIPTTDPHAPAVTVFGDRK